MMAAIRTIITWSILMMFISTAILLLYVARLENSAFQVKKISKYNGENVKIKQSKTYMIDDKTAWEMDERRKKTRPISAQDDKMPLQETVWKNTSKLAAHFRPRQMAQPVKVLDLDSLAMIRTDEDQINKDTGYRKYAFNALISDRIGERRELPDVRNQLCKGKVYSSSLSKASIIICFYNEAPSALIRMVNSILDRTPHRLIHEILLVNDMSDDGTDIVGILSEYSTLNWPRELMGILTTDRREGLIRAKVFGSEKATGEVLVFLDSHCEVNRMWLEPLLERIDEDPHDVVCPIIDIIDMDTFHYFESPICTGGLTWNLAFKWDYPDANSLRTPEDYVTPLKSASMAGGLFAISKQYFDYLGQYDKGMDVWGVENVEFSFRIWMCGGQLHIVPCSRVGHIFRKRRPYGLNSNSMNRNSIRAARVWLDEYLEKFFESRPNLRSDTSYGDISEQIALRKRLNCHSFGWYLEHVYPELLSGDRRSKIHRLKMHNIKDDKSLQNVDKGQLRLMNSNYCLSSEVTHGRTIQGSSILVDLCDRTSRSQIWRFTEMNELRPMSSGRLCLDGAKAVRLMKCHMMGGHQKWTFRGQYCAYLLTHAQLYNAATGMCLCSESKIESFPSVAFPCRCLDNDDNSHWEFVANKSDNF